MGTLPTIHNHEKTNPPTMKEIPQLARHDYQPTAWPYLLPSMRGNAGLKLYHQFYGSVKARIAMRQKQLWSMVIGAGFIAEDIQTVWPEDNLEFFGMKYSDCMQSFRLADLNLRELHELAKWLEARLPDLETEVCTSQTN